MKLMQAAGRSSLVLGLAGLPEASRRSRTSTGAGTTVPGRWGQTTGVDGSTTGQASDLGTAQQQALAALKTRSVIYFDYDSSEIRSEYLQVVAAHAAYLVKYPNARVRLEGHTDERGSREYNIGLGERRAQAVRRALQLQGAAETQIATVSYGEERPAVGGRRRTALRAESSGRDRSCPVVRMDRLRSTMAAAAARLAALEQPGARRREQSRARGPCECDGARVCRPSSASSKALVELQQQIEAAREELRALRGQIDEAKHELDGAAPAAARPVFGRGPAAAA